MEVIQEIESVECFIMNDFTVDDFKISLSHSFAWVNKLKMRQSKRGGELQ